MPVLIDMGRGTIIAHRSRRHFQGVAEKMDALPARSFHRHYHAARQGVGVGKYLFYRCDTTCWNFSCHKAFLPAFSGIRLQGGGHDRVQQVDVDDTVAIVPEAGVVCQIGGADDQAEAGELAVVSHRNREFTLGGCKGLIGRDIRMPVADAPGTLPDTRWFVAALISQATCVS